MTHYLADLAHVLRSAGCVVVELDGWATRGRGDDAPYEDGRPWCVMWHHTASAGDGADDADYCTFRNPDAPLTNLVIGRDGIVYVCAAGPTNTNGKGGPLTVSRGTVPVDSMNSYAIGIEISNGGTGMVYPQVQIDACFAASVAMTGAYGLDPGDVANHADWSPGRKIDCATAPAVEGPWRPAPVGSSLTWSYSDLRAENQARATPGNPDPVPPPIGDDDMTTVLILKDVRNGAMYRCGAESKSWIRDGHMSAQCLARVDETNAHGQAIDGMVYRYQENGNVDYIRSSGPIVGPVPAGVDEYGG